MPVMDGMEAAKTIRRTVSTEYQPFIVALTAQVMQGDRDRCLTVGMSDYISKPVAKEDLLRILTIAPRLEPNQLIPPPQPPIIPLPPPQPSLQAAAAAAAAVATPPPPSSLAGVSGATLDTEANTTSGAVDVAPSTPIVTTLSTHVHHTPKREFNNTPNVVTTSSGSIPAEETATLPTATNTNATGSDSHTLNTDAHHIVDSSMPPSHTNSRDSHSLPRTLLSSSSSTSSSLSTPAGRHRYQTEHTIS
jgi:CheY-like chemotaxis protein